MIGALCVATFAAAAGPQSLWAADVAAVGQVRFAKLDDGTELIHVAVPRATEESMRLVFRVGFADEKKRGVAHLLEHAVFHGDPERDEKGWLGSLRADGARANAFTSAESTEYVVDAPIATASHAMRSLITFVTNPALELADVADESKVVAVEELLRPRLTLDFALDIALFPHEGAAPSDDPHDLGRSNTDLDSVALQDFYAEHYRSKTLTVVAVGPMSFDDVAALFASESRLAPATDETDAEPLAGTPHLPIDLDVPSGRLMELIAYRVNDTQHVCDDLAMLFRLRLVEARNVSTACVEVRSSRFVVAAREGDVLDAGDLEEAFQTAAKRAAHGPGVGDDAALARMRRGRLALLRATPGTLADGLAEIAAAREDRGSLLAQLFDPKVTGNAALKNAAKQTFSEQNRAVLRFTPFAH